MLYFKRILFFLLLLTTTFVQAEKVAVVLSGGGAKGFSHIGVLKALEEYNIPIDYITGTSMGAIVGGLYASGYSPNEIEKLMTSPEFMEWASGEISNKFLHYYKIPESNSSWVSIPFQIDEKFNPRLAFTLVPTHIMDFTFMELFAGPSAASNYNFDNLFIPFRCVAADIEANSEVVLKDGQLGDALRASMAVPLYFSPLRVRGRLLFDGGMYNNFPVDIAYRVFSPDVIIGSKAASNFEPPEDDDVVSQLQNMLMEKTDYNFIPGKGILIKPELGNINIVDFSRAQEFIEHGYTYTVEQIELIESLVERRSDPDSLYQKRLAFYNRKPAIVIDSISVNGLDPAQSQYVNRQIGYKDNRLITLTDFKNDYYGLVADDKIRSVYPRLVYNPKTAHYDLNLDVKKVDNFLVEFGGNLSSNANNQGFIGLHYKYLAKRAVDYGLEMSFGRFYSGGNAKIRTDFPAKTPLFVQFEYTSHVKDYFKNSTYFVDNIDPSFLVQHENYFRAAIGFPITNQSKLLGGVTVGRLKDEYYQTNDFISTDITEITRFDFFSPYIFYEYNTLNRKMYPTEGMRLTASFRYVWGEEEHLPGIAENADGSIVDFSAKHDYYQISGVFESYVSFFRGWKVGLYGELYVSNRPFYSNYTASILAAHQFQPTLESSLVFLPNYCANNYFAFGVRNITNIYKSIDLRLEAYAFQPQKLLRQDTETKQAFYGERFSDRAYIASASLVLNTHVGPVSVTANYYSNYKESFTFMFNAGFYIFSKWALN
jgi:NTE family protein